VTLLAGHENFIEDLAFSPDDTRLVSVAMEGPVHIWDVASGKRIARATGHTRYLKAVAFAPDGRTFATAGADRTVRIWETDECREIACHIGHTAVIYDIATHPEGVVSFSFDGTARLWGTTEHEPVKTVATDVGPIAKLAFNQTGALLALASRDGSRLEVRDTGSLARVEARRFDPLQSPHAGSIRFDASGRAVLERTARQAAAPTPGHLGGDVVTRTAVTRFRIAALTSRGELYLLDAESLAIIARLKGHSDKVSSMAFCPDGSRLVSGGHDGSVRLWDTATGSQVAVLHGHSDRVFSVAFSRNGERIASGTQQGEVRIWTAPAESAR
jgi:WD40 repeat protein